MQLNIVFAILGLCAAVQETSTSRNANSGLLSGAAATRVSQATAFSELDKTHKESDKESQDVRHLQPEVQAQQQQPTQPQQVPLQSSVEQSIKDRENILSLVRKIAHEESDKESQDVRHLQPEADALNEYPERTSMTIFPARLPYGIRVARDIVIFIASVMFVPAAYIICFMADNSSDTTPEDFHWFRVQVWELNLAFHIASIISTASAYYAIVEYDGFSDASEKWYVWYPIAFVAELIITIFWCCYNPKDNEITFESGDAMYWVLIPCALQAVHLLMMVIFMLNQKTLWKWEKRTYIVGDEVSFSVNGSSGWCYIWPALLLIVTIIYDVFVLYNHSQESSRE